MSFYLFRSALNRSAVREAAVAAGISVLRFISEPAAVALAYDIAQDQSRTETALIVDVGGSKVRSHALNDGDAETDV